MNQQDRFKRMREAERVLQKLVDKGWRVESVTYTDETDEPLRAEIHLSIESPSVLGGMI